MLRNSRVAWVVALLFTLVNLAGIVLAMLAGERVHTGIHAGLTLVGAFFMWYCMPRRVSTY